MPRRYRPQEVIRVLEHFGWVFNRQRGSHVILTKTGYSGLATVPMSHNEVRIGTFGKILKDAGIDRRDFDRIANEVL